MQNRADENRTGAEHASTGGTNLTQSNSTFVRGAEWIEDCMRWRGKVLTGKGAHYCYDWDFLPVDETTPEWDACVCFQRPLPPSD